ncbi:L-2,4-diaminobutyric acid acetyltransferase [Mycobacterium frederiksbergense]|uniref:L-2,4-diaminobutyric acid acetyltransferase n=1 Tax=Mycolicibacterium frederiksbergense TaxID=117567 RepID=A0ABT6KWP2_9MYCO|nr:diaminobutyrate acetyltransferase [Mycolicibacterium frederiksbergense]MDH6195127.1 L-2,4-diaminobutyric acid acetyltransferase [Mycolicibacterium frederiksbergense]
MRALQSVPGRHSREELLRPPRGVDAIGIRDLAEATGVLDLNSAYAYLLLATDFAATSIVAECDGGLRGFITGYHPPPRPDVLFVWQVAVSPTVQGGGLASTMLDALVHRVRSQRCGQPVTVEATVAPSNAASRAFFGAFARRHGVPLVEDPHFGRDLLDADGAHEEEPILRMGPIASPVFR